MGELRFLGGAPGATRSYPLHERPGTDPTGREKKCPSGRCPVTQHRQGSGVSPGRDAGAASPVGDTLDVVAAVPAHERRAHHDAAIAATQNSAERAYLSRKRGELV